MTATTTQRFLDHAGEFPIKGTFPAAANVILVKGTIVQADASGRAIPGADGNGFHAVGVSNATYDNRTASEYGGAAGAINVEVTMGVFGFAFSGTPLPGETVWVLDNQTVVDDSDGGARGVAGVVVEVTGTVCYVWIGVHVAALFSDDSALGTDVVALQDEIAARVPTFDFNLLGARVYSTGVIAGAFTADVADGFDPTAESIGYRFNDDSTAAIALEAPLPMDLDPAEDIVLHVLGYRVGALDTTAAVDVTAFFRTAGAAFSADADAGGDSSAFAAATTVVSDVTRTLAAADVPAPPASLLITLVPTAALDADDLVILSVFATYTKLTA